jgi:hypothetical protein
VRALKVAEVHDITTFGGAAAVGATTLMVGRAMMDWTSWAHGRPRAATGSRSITIGPIRPTQQRGHGGVEVRFGQRRCDVGIH